MFVSKQPRGAALKAATRGHTDIELRERGTNKVHCFSGCTEVCPAGINITDNAIIPLKERVVTEFYDPLVMLTRKFRSD